MIERLPVRDLIRDLSQDLIRSDGAGLTFVLKTGTDYTETFTYDDGTNWDASFATYWNTVTAGVGFSILNNALNFTQTAYAYRNFFSKFALTGAFEIQIDYAYLAGSTAPQNGVNESRHSLQIHATTSPSSLAEDRHLDANRFATTAFYRFGGHGDSGNFVSVNNANAENGKFKVWRGGDNIVRMAYWSGAQFDYNGDVNGAIVGTTSSPIYIALRTLGQSTTELQAAFDNFTIVSAAGVNWNGAGNWV